MIKSVCFVPRYVAENLDLDDEYAVISITDNGQKPALIKGTEQILRISFLDIEEAINHEKFKEDYLFDSNKAKTISDFVTKLHTGNDFSHVKYLVVHCEAGVSRSAAVALFVHYFTNCTFTMLSQANFANKLAVKELSKYNNIDIVIPDKPSTEDEIILLPNKKNLF